MRSRVQPRIAAAHFFEAQRTVGQIAFQQRCAFQFPTRRWRDLFARNISIKIDRTFMSYRPLSAQPAQATKQLENMNQIKM